MTNELDLKTGPYLTTYIGLEINRESTSDEWKQYGEILRRVDEAKQWAIGDWLVDGKSHYGDGVYDQASEKLWFEYNVLARYLRISALFEISLRKLNLTWAHHNEVSSIKQTEKEYNKEGAPTGKLEVSKEPDMEQIQALLSKAEKEKWSVRDLREAVRKYKEEQQELIRLANEPEKSTIIYADPPWQYTSGDQHSGEEQETVIGSHYPSMSISEI